MTTSLSKPLQRAIFILFFVSGFCALLYQVIWVRLAMSHFGVITPVISVVLSTFMLGLGLGSWISGYGLLWFKGHRNVPLPLYALTEAVIGLGAWAVPSLFSLGDRLMLGLGEMQSTPYLLCSGLCIALALFPWCFCMGMTFPLLMAAMKERDLSPKTTFSFLYLANGLGAMTGCLVTAFIFVEVFGFHRTLWIAGVLNLGIAGLSLWLAGRFPPCTAPASQKEIRESRGPQSTREIRVILFTTAFFAMACEILWTRLFTSLIGTTVYAFASVVATYLLATGIGSYLYRRDLERESTVSLGTLIAVLMNCALLPIVVNIPGLHLGATGALLSIVPLCTLLGYLTPSLIDRYSQGFPDAAGRAYAINIAGSMLGPLVASYRLLPWLGVRYSILVLSIPFWVLHVRNMSRAHRSVQVLSVLLALLGAGISIAGSSYEEQCPHPGPHDMLRRDYAATVICCGTGWDRQLFVNGVGMTRLAFVTKAMAHLPLGCYPGRPRTALNICFGMGTTYRSLLTWGVRTTAVELVPSVPRVFGFFSEDATSVLDNPLGTVVVDDGRRFLRRTKETYDVITIDPPPPVEAAGSGLLYSEEFYGILKAHLTPDGILQEWWPEGEERIVQATARSLSHCFPYVRVFKGRGVHGFHFLASMRPIRVPSLEAFKSKLPEAARQDLREWAPGHDLTVAVRSMTLNEIPIARFLPDARTATITDDCPYNEYYLLRRTMDRMAHRLVFVN